MFKKNFYQIQAYYPLRNQVSFDLSMKDARQLLSIASTDNNKYKIEIQQIRLKLVFAEFEQRIRER